MPVILILEGLTDATFFQELLARLYLQDVERVFSDLPGRRNMPMGIRGSTASGLDTDIQFRYLRENGGDSEGGKDQIPPAIRLLLDGVVQKFAVSRDINGDTPELIVQSVRDVAVSCLGAGSVSHEAGSHEVVLDHGSIIVMPMGLFHDPALSDLGVTQHELEDYLIKVLLEDAELRDNVPELPALLAEVLTSIRRYQVPIDSGKDVYQPLKPILQLPISDTGAVRRIIRSADIDILRSVLGPLLVDVERALGV